MLSSCCPPDSWPYACRLLSGSAFPGSLFVLSSGFREAPADAPGHPVRLSYSEPLICICLFKNSEPILTRHHHPPGARISNSADYGRGIGGTTEHVFATPVRNPCAQCPIHNAPPRLQAPVPHD